MATFPPMPPAPPLSSEGENPEDVYNIFDDDGALIRYFEKVKRECLADRWVWEREWLRDIYYVMGRQWIMYHPTKREWVDKRLHKWVPKPVTNKMAEAVQAIRTTFGSIDLGITAAPVGASTKSISTAEVADQMAPLIHEEHLMNQVMREADFWLIVTGTVLLQMSWDRDKRFNRSFIQHEECLQCGFSGPPKDIIDQNNRCPMCGGTQFMSKFDEGGNPVGEEISFGRGKTVALSPFEYAFPQTITRFDEIPYLLRIRWREKNYFEANYPELMTKITWEHSPKDRSLQLYKALATTNDLGMGNSLQNVGRQGSSDAEGVTEYEMWCKPNDKFPMGAVVRLIGDSNPLILREPDQGLPGPIPYRDIDGKPIWPFAMAQYEHVGGRLYGRSALSPVIQKQDQLNQLDSLIQLIIQRMANPIWVVPEGAGIDEFGGEPGFVMKWNPLAAGGSAKPERIPGMEVPQSILVQRQQLLDDIENLTGTYDIIKGQKPAGVEAFSALQLLVERSQSRFTSVFQSRGEMYRRWFEVALEMERQFGPDERVMAVVSPNKSYAFKHFLNAQLQGAITIKVEDGSAVPKTTLGKRAAIEQANQLRLIDPSDPELRYGLLSQFGLQDLVPSLNIHVQTALQMQDAFEDWMENPEGPSPLANKPWMDPQIHWAERVKWLNTDKMRDALAASPELEQIVMMHLQELQFILNPPMMEPGMLPEEGGAPGSGQSMNNSNRNSTSTGIVPGGNGQMAQGMGPV